MKVLVTGATGLVGSGLVKRLIAEHHQVFALVRDISLSLPETVRQIAIGDLSLLSEYNRVNVNRQKRYEGTLSPDLYSNNQLEDIFQEIDDVIHLAARVHVMKEHAADPLREFRRVNTEATLSLAEQAAKAGVKRFIFLSTIKVNGESTTDRLPFSEEDDCNPTDPYAVSKLEAEQGLMEIGRNTGMEVVIIRPPLVYGLGVKGNFASMMRWVARGIPLPLGAVRNKRSFLALGNLVSFIICCLKHPKAANQVFLLSDGEDISTPALIEKLAQSQGKKARLIPIPVSWMKFGAKILGKSDVANRVLGSLQLDSRKARSLLNWSSVISIDEQLKEMHGYE